MLLCFLKTIKIYRSPESIFFNVLFGDAWSPFRDTIVLFPYMEENKRKTWTLCFTEATLSEACFLEVHVLDGLKRQPASWMFF